MAQNYGCSQLNVRVQNYGCSQLNVRSFALLLISRLLCAIHLRGIGELECEPQLP